MEMLVEWIFHGIHIEYHWIPNLIFTISIIFNIVFKQCHGQSYRGLIFASFFCCFLLLNMYVIKFHSLVYRMQTALILYKKETHFLNFPLCFDWQLLFIEYPSWNIILNILYKQNYVSASITGSMESIFYMKIALREYLVFISISFYIQCLTNEL